jgi:hypothetical protein
MCFATHQLVSLFLFLLVYYFIKIQKNKNLIKMSLEIILQINWKMIVNWELAFEFINQLIKR